MLIRWCTAAIYSYASDDNYEVRMQRRNNNYCKQLMFDGENQAAEIYIYVELVKPSGHLWPEWRYRCDDRSAFSALHVFEISIDRRKYPAFPTAIAYLLFGRNPRCKLYTKWIGQCADITTNVPAGRERSLLSPDMRASTTEWKEKRNEAKRWKNIALFLARMTEFAGYSYL